MLKLTTILVLFYSVGFNDSARILGLFPMQGKSHFIMFEALMKGLANRGHEVDVVSHFPQKRPIPRYNDLSVEGTVPNLVNNISYTIIQELSLNKILDFIFTTTGTDLCESILFSPVLEQLKQSDVKYDAIITEVFGTDCFLGFSHHFKAPVIGMVSSVLLPWNNERFGNPDNPSFIPNYFMPYTNSMTLYQRLMNTVVLIFSNLKYHYHSILPSDVYVKRFFGSHYPSLEALTKNMSLLLANSHISINGARPLAPNVIEVGGLHVNPPGELTGKLGEIMNSSNNGVIYFSLGSLVKSETLPSNVIRALLDAFGELPYTILWKTDPANLPVPIPKNIRFATWMPQMDILCHPNTKLFITHGGMMGTQEAIYCGIPLIGIPLFADQIFNIRSYKHRGIAVHLDINKITKDNVVNAVNTVLDNPSYKLNVERLSSLFRDRPQSAMDIAIYWVEYVIRYKGAAHLRPTSADLTWYQYYLIDVLLILLTAVIAAAFASYQLVKMFLEHYFRPGKQKIN